jgi:hypothetical protein
MCSPAAANDAWRATRSFVRARLKNPVTADFSDTDRVFIEWLEACDFLVFGHVDAQNELRELTRTQHHAYVRYVPETDRWVLLQLDLWSIDKPRSRAGASL